MYRDGLILRNFHDSLMKERNEIEGANDNNEAIRYAWRTIIIHFRSATSSVDTIYA